MVDSSFSRYLIVGVGNTLVGLSVIIPYIGATVVTLPIALIAYFQWGWTSDFAWLMVAYLVIQALDGNVLVPLLFSEVVNLHPVAIIVAILVFGGLWGFWGVFFAIPLATLVKAVLSASSTSPVRSCESREPSCSVKLAARTSRSPARMSREREGVTCASWSTLHICAVVSKPSGVDTASSAGLRGFE